MNKLEATRRLEQLKREMQKLEMVKAVTEEQSTGGKDAKLKQINRSIEEVQEQITELEQMIKEDK